MPYADREKRIQFLREYRKNNKEAISASRKKRYKEQNPFRPHPIEHVSVKVRIARKNQDMKTRVMVGYGGKCSSCPESRMEALTLDHVADDGNVHRKELGTGYSLYRYALREGFPPNLQCLCWNCQMRKKKVSKKPELELSPAGRSIRRLRAEVLNAYGAKCKKCGTEEEEILCLDHVNGGGVRHLKEAKSSRAGYRDARDRSYPTDYRVLCATCNALEYWNTTAANPLHKFLDQRGRFLIPADEWANVKLSYSKQDIENYISSLAPHISLEPRHTTQKVEEDFKKLLKSKFEIINGALPLAYTGKKSSDYFHFNNRLNALGENGVSSKDAWLSNPRKFVAGLWVWGAEEGVSRDNFVRYMTLFNKMPQQFRPAAAKALYDHFQAKQVLDCCMGWGDRLAGFWASGAEEYWGFDPNLDLHPGYKAQCDAYQNIIQKRVNINALPIEDAALPDSYFDLSFTSPPYFRAELYSDHPGQSRVRYPEFSAWVNGFLHPFVQVQKRALKTDGHMIVNIADTGGLPLVERLRGLALDEGFTLEDEWTYPIGNRFGGGNQRSEPVLVFRKT